MNQFYVHEDRMTGWLGLILLTAVSSATHGSQPTPPSPAADVYVDTVAQCARLDAVNVFLQGQSPETAAARGKPWSTGVLLERLDPADADTVRVVAAVFEQNATPLKDDLNLAADQLRHELTETKAAAARVRTQLEDRRTRLAEAAQIHRAVARPGFLFSADRPWFWFWGIAAVLILTALVIHHSRQVLRRRLGIGVGMGGRWTALAVILLPLGGLAAAAVLIGSRMVGAGSPASSPPVEAVDDTLPAETKTLLERRRQLQTRHDELLSQQQFQATGTVATNPVEAETVDAETAARPDWPQFRRQVLEIVGTLGAMQGTADAVEAGLTEIESLQGRIDSESRATVNCRRWRDLIQSGLGMLMLAVTGTGGYAFWRCVGRRRREVAATCPLCLGRNHLKPVRSPASPNGKPAGGKNVQCENVVSHEPYERCGYTFRQRYRSLPKACFPTLGVPQAGKTHWLAMLYWELNRGNYPGRVRFEKVKSQTSLDFDVMIEEILEARIGTAATQRERIPHPIVFSFQDHDRWGRSDVLVNVFDYSGEVTSDMGLDDYRRRRALEAEGYVFFLDPTFPAEPQARALADFREDLRLASGVGTGRRVDVPVALCLSKIDLLAAQSYALPDGGDAVQQFYQDLGKIDPSGEAMTREVIRRRSHLTARLSETIWPGWKIERQFRDFVGRRFAFFPLTPVGLDGRGEPDLSLRTISPFGLLEPLVWLLQMNGYAVLD